MKTLLAFALLLTPSVFAQITVTSFTIDCGGGVISAGNLRITGSIGQPDARAPLAGGVLVLHPGFITPKRSCVADVDDGTSTGTRDGGVTIDDLLYYLFIFEQGSITADVDDGSGTGMRDGGVTIDDLLYFLQRFEAGC